MENLAERLEEIYGQKAWVISVQAAVAATGLNKLLEGWGSRTLVVASNEGTGERPDTEVIYTGSKGDSAVGSIREFFHSVEHPSARIQKRVDEFDPDQQAAVIAEPYATASVMVGRKTFGVRRDEWWTWEDKMRVDALWEDLDVSHAPYSVLPVADAPTAANSLANEMGSVWVADNSQGWHGGGEFVRWIRKSDEFDEAVRWFADRADRVRVMPFLEGLPCSIHGWVTHTGVAVFLPVEILIFRDLDSSTLVYAGVSTAWTAPSGLADEMREIASKVGTELGYRVGYRGPFGVDGVATVDGFRPTELNPRMSAGAGIQLTDVDIPLGALMRAEIEEMIEVDHQWLEEEALGNRVARIHLAKMVNVEARGSVFVAVGDDGALKIVDAEDQSMGKITAGPAATGSFVTGSFEAGEIEVGPATGPFVASALNLASETWNLGIPRLTAAPNLVV